MPFAVRSWGETRRLRDDEGEREGPEAGIGVASPDERMEVLITRTAVQVEPKLDPLKMQEETVYEAATGAAPGRAWEDMFRIASIEGIPAHASEIPGAVHRRDHGERDIPPVRCGQFFGGFDAGIFVPIHASRHEDSGRLVGVGVPDCEGGSGAEIGHEVWHSTDYNSSMELVRQYLARDVGVVAQSSWEEIRRAYLARAATILADDHESPSYLTSGMSEAGRRTGKILSNVNDYTRDHHDLSLVYEAAYARAYLPRLGMLRPQPCVTVSGMAALTTIVTMLTRLSGTAQTILVGKHSYFQNQELLTHAFDRVIFFEETDQEIFRALVTRERPLAVFVDTLCNEEGLTVPPVMEMAAHLAHLEWPVHLVVDNSLLGPGFPWKQLFACRSRQLTIIGWESLNKFAQFGLDRTTGGIVFGSSIRCHVGLFYARMHAGTILPTTAALQLPTPSARVMRVYLERLETNAREMVAILEHRVNQRRVAQVMRATTPYAFSGANITIAFRGKVSVEELQKKIATMIRRARCARLSLTAGTSFGLPVTRVYATAREAMLLPAAKGRVSVRPAGHIPMFFRISVGTEELSELSQLAEIIASSL